MIFELTFDDSYTLSSFGMKNMEGNEKQLLGDISSKTQNIPGVRGLYDFGDEVGAFKEKFPILVLANDPLDRSYRLREFTNFILDDYGYPRLMKIQKSSEPDVYYWGKVTTPSIPKLYSNAGSFTLEVICLEGIKHGSTSANDILWGSTKVRFNAGYTLGNTGTGANGITITSNQSIDSYVDGKAVKPSIKLVGSGTNVKITCAGKSITVGTFSSQTVTIDTEMFVAYFGGVERLIDMDDFYIVPNSKINVTGTNMNFVLTIDYQNVYM